MFQQLAAVALCAAEPATEGVRAGAIFLWYLFLQPRTASMPQKIHESFFALLNAACGRVEAAIKEGKQSV